MATVYALASPWWVCSFTEVVIIVHLDSQIQTQPTATRSLRQPCQVVVVPLANQLQQLLFISYKSNGDPKPQRSSQRKPRRNRGQVQLSVRYRTCCICACVNAPGKVPFFMYVKGLSLASNTCSIPESENQKFKFVHFPCFSCTFENYPTSTFPGKSKLDYITHLEIFILGCNFFTLDLPVVPTIQASQTMPTSGFIINTLGNI